MSDSLDDLAGRLLDAQVAFAMRQLTDPAELAALVEEEVDAFLAESATLTLGEAMPRELIKQVARKYTMAFPVEGAIPELTGQVAARLYEHRVNDETAVADVVAQRRFDELTDTLAEMHVSHRAVRAALGSPRTVDVVVEVVQRALEEAAPFGRSGRVRGVMDAAVESVTRKVARFVLDANADEADVLIVDAAREFWRGRAEESVSGFRELVDASDVEDVVVLVFESWRTLRETEYFGTLLDAAVDEVFDYFGDTPLHELLAELGLDREDLVEEALRFGPPVISRIDGRGFLDLLLRRRLAPFYVSAEYHAALAATPGS